MIDRPVWKVSKQDTYLPNDNDTHPYNFENALFNMWILERLFISKKYNKNYKVKILYYTRKKYYTEKEHNKVSESIKKNILNKTN